MGVDKAGGTAKVLASADPTCGSTMADSIAVDDTAIYWSMCWASEEVRKADMCFCRGAILKTPFSGGVIPISALQATGTPKRLAVSDAHVYYIADGAKEIRRVPK